MQETRPTIIESSSVWKVTSQTSLNSGFQTNTDTLCSTLASGRAHRTATHQNTAGIYSQKPKNADVEFQFLSPGRPGVRVCQRSWVSEKECVVPLSVREWETKGRRGRGRKLRPVNTCLFFPINTHNSSSSPLCLIGKWVMHTLLLTPNIPDIDGAKFYIRCAAVIHRLTLTHQTQCSGIPGTKWTSRVLRLSGSVSLEKHAGRQTPTNKNVTETKKKIWHIIW